MGDGRSSTYVHARSNKGRGGTRGLTLGVLDDAVQDKHLPENFGLEGEDGRVAFRRLLRHIAWPDHWEELGMIITIFIVT